MTFIKYIILESLINEGRKEDVYQKYYTVYKKSLEDRINQIEEDIKSLEERRKGNLGFANFDSGLREIVDHLRKVVERLRETLDDRLKLFDGAFNFFVERDPSGNLKYLDWAIKEWVGAIDADFENANAAFLVSLANLIKDFHELQPRIKSRDYSTDINQYDYDKLKEVVTKIKIEPTKKELKKQSERIFEDDDWLVIRPLSHAASCYYGANTKWCTTMANDPSYFKSYSKPSRLLVYIIEKKTNKKLAIAKKTSNELEYFDAKDQMVPQEWIDKPDTILYSIEDEPELLTAKMVLKWAERIAEMDFSAEDLDDAFSVVEDDYGPLDTYDTSHIPILPKYIKEKIGIRIQSHTKEMESTNAQLTEHIYRLLENRFDFKFTPVDSYPSGKRGAIRPRWYVYENKEGNDFAYQYSIGGITEQIFDILVSDGVLDSSLETHGAYRDIVREIIKKYIHRSLMLKYPQYYDEETNTFIVHEEDWKWESEPDDIYTYESDSDSMHN